VAVKTFEIDSPDYFRTAATLQMLLKLPLDRQNPGQTQDHTWNREQNEEFHASTRKNPNFLRGILHFS